MTNEEAILAELAALGIAVAKLVAAESRRSEDAPAFIAAFMALIAATASGRSITYPLTMTHSGLPVFLNL